MATKKQAGEVKRLPVSFRKYGYEFEQVERNEQAAIYSQAYQGKVLAYEVVKIRIRSGAYNDLFGKLVPTREHYPASSDWGEYGWTVMTLAQAQAKMKKICSSQ